jgi:hypothetical protein
MRTDASTKNRAIVPFKHAAALIRIQQSAAGEPPQHPAPRSTTRPQVASEHSSNRLVHTAVVDGVKILYIFTPTHRPSR